MSANETDWLEAGLICCGLTRGMTFSVRHIRYSSAAKNRIITTGDQLYAAFCICCTFDCCGALTVAAGEDEKLATGTIACVVCA